MPPNVFVLVTRCQGRRHARMSRSLTWRDAGHQLGQGFAEGPHLPHTEILHRPYPFGQFSPVREGGLDTRSLLEVQILQGRIHRSDDVTGQFVLALAYRGGFDGQRLDVTPGPRDRPPQTTRPCPPLPTPRRTLPAGA